MTKEFAIHMIALYRTLPEKERETVKAYARAALTDSYAVMVRAKDEFENTVWLATEIGAIDRGDTTETISEGMPE